MASCCEDKRCEINQLLNSQRRVLWTVLIINSAMFLVEGLAGLMAHSTSLLADGLDMLGDALVYGFSLLAVGRSSVWQATAALAKGIFMLLFGLAVLAEALYKALFAELPNAGIMGVVGALALAANLACFASLYRHRSDNLNMTSTWLCSRNDLLANLGVLAAAAASHWFSSRWPDILVGVPIALLFLSSALKVISGARQALRPAPPSITSIGSRLTDNPRRAR